MARCIFVLLSPVLLACSPISVAAGETDDGFTSMFNGKDLTGWDGKPGWWYVENGAITSQTTPEKPCKKCNYLIWKGGAPGDFELRLKFRIVGGNSGIQFRSQQIPDWDTRGYQADIDAAGQWAGALFQHARGGVAMRGQKVAIAEDGQKQITSIGDPADLLKHIKKDDWNDYCIVARGNEITLKINGVMMSQAIDQEKDKCLHDGIIGLQIHPGPPMKIQFKDLQIEILDAAEGS